MEARGGQVVILIGPKGAGKTHIGALLEKRMNIPFLRTEYIWLDYIQTLDLPFKKKVEKFYNLIEVLINEKLRTSPRICFESTGAAPKFHEHLDRISSKFNTKVVAVRCSPDECLKRVKERDQSQHIPVSDDRVNEINQIAQSVTLKWDLVFDNSKKVHEEDIVSTFRELVSE